ncbi:MAG TPA: sugar ABC transporter permease [Anaerolineales bacterium]|nr:sugar ABC transporter permease [Anaerolineales bacterium]
MSSLGFFQGFRSSRRRQRQLKLVLTYLFAAIMIVFALFPIIWIISASLNPANSLATQSLIPRNASLQNYQLLLTDNDFSAIYPFRRWLFNSVKLAGVTTLFSVSITTAAAYAFSRFRFRQRQNMLRGILLIQVFPSLLVMVAVFLLIQQIGSVIPDLGLNTHNGLVLTYLGGCMGINIWLMKGYFDSIPREIDESAMVDGATHWQIFTRLLLPLMRPIVVVVAVLSFIFVYGDFVVARILLKTTEQYPLTVGLFIFTSGQFQQQWGVFAAGALMGALPIVVLYLLLQDQIIGGLTQGAVKG